MPEAKKKKSETFESLLRRFNKKILQSGRILQAKKVRFKQKPVNKNLQKELALKKIQTRDYKEYLKKVGKLNED